MTDHEVVDRDTWLTARKALLVKEKAFTRERDGLSAERRALPWVKIDKAYRFDTPAGEQSLADLFAGKNQLIVYHFMLGEDWDAGCPSCSFWADTYEGIVPHLAARDIALVTVSSAPLDRIEAYRERMGWTFRWVSAYGSDFNRDYHVSFAEGDSGYYNYKEGGFSGPEAPGVSVFARDGETVYHTYSCYARGLDILNNAYHYMDLTPKGRDETGLDFTMGWLKRHDEYAA